jgi:O-antigen/teichoic acid export membrane protein
VHNSIKNSIIRGVLWSAVEKFSVQIGQFVIFIFLARLLTPKDFGLVGMLAIFIAVSQTFIDSGMERGLIQKQDRSLIDFSTVFVFNFLVSVFFYCVLFCVAPAIAVFYKSPQLVLLTRILTLDLIFNSFSIVQRSKLIIDVDFKTLAKINFFSVVVGGSVGILCGYYGLGVWSLVVQNLLRSILSLLMFWATGSWKLSFKFSKQSFKVLFGFGSKLLLAGLYAQTLNNIYNIVIGRAYNAESLGLFTRARQFNELSAGTVAVILNQVTFPVLSSLQNDQTRMVYVYKRVIRMTALLNFPVMTLLFFLAKPLVFLLLTDKWSQMVTLLQIMCFAYVFYPTSFINMNILNAIGRSDLFLKADLLKFPFVVLTLIISIPLGIKAMTVGFVITSFIAFLINSYYPGKFFKYGAVKQIKDVLLIIYATVVMSVFIYASTLLLSSDLLKLIICTLLGISSFLFTAYFLRIDEINELILAIKKFLKTRE